MKDNSVLKTRFLLLALLTIFLVILEAAISYQLVNKTQLVCTLVIFVSINVCALLTYFHYFSQSSTESYTSLLNANDRLRKTEKRLSLYYQASSVGIWDIVDIKADEVYWSPQIKNLLGYDLDDDIQPTSSTFLYLIHPDHRKRVQKASMMAILNSTCVDEDFLVHTQHEGYRWFRGRAIGSIDAISGAKRFTGSIHDIHTEKMAEQKLSESIAFMKLVLDNNPDMVFIKDRNHVVVEGNKAYYAEYPPDSSVQHRKTQPEKYKSLLDTDDNKAFANGYS